MDLDKLAEWLIRWHLEDQKEATAEQWPDYVTGLSRGRVKGLADAIDVAAADYQEPERQTVYALAETLRVSDLGT